MAKSALDDEIKQNLLDNMEKMPEPVLMSLIESLKKEQEAATNLAFDFAEFFYRQDHDWAKLADDQQKAADDIVNRVIEETKTPVK